MNHLHETCQRLNALKRDRVQFANKIYQADAELQIVASARVLQILFARWVPRVFVPKSISAASRYAAYIYEYEYIYRYSRGSGPGSGIGSGSGSGSII